MLGQGAHQTVIQFCIVRKIMLDDRSRREYGRLFRNQIREELPHLQGSFWRLGLGRQSEIKTCAAQGVVASP